MAGSAETSDRLAAPGRSAARDKPGSPEKSLCIVFVLAGLGAGGAEKIINMLAHHRLALGDRVHILALNAADNLSYFPYDRRISLDSLGAVESGLANPLAICRKMIRLHQRLRDLRPNLVISFLTKINAQTSLVARTLGIPVIVSERNNFRTQPMNRVWRLASTAGFVCSTRIAMQTDAARSALPSFLKPKIWVIPNPVASDTSVIGKRTESRHVVSVGRLDRQKGFDLLLDAFAIARTQLPDLRLTIFGEGPERSTLEGQAKGLRIDDAVIFPGVTAVPGGWRSGADIFVLSSRFEGFPNALAEALASGIPSIAYDCDWGPREIIRHGHNGLLVPSGDIKALADSLVELATDDRLRRQMSVISASDLRFSASTILGTWDALISEAVGAADKISTDASKEQACRAGP